MSVPPTLSVGWPISSRVGSFFSHVTLPGSPTQLDLFEPGATRTGPAVVEGNAIDLFDARNTRPGSGRIRDGEVETFDRSGAARPLGNDRRRASARRGKGQGDKQGHESRKVVPYRGG